MIDTGPMRFPPYTKNKLAVINFLMKTMPDLPSIGLKDVVILGLSVAVAVLSAKVAGKF
jgi:hypothetical protein